MRKHKYYKSNFCNDKIYEVDLSEDDLIEMYYRDIHKLESIYFQKTNKR